MSLDALVLPGMAMLYKHLARVPMQTKLAHMGKQQCLTMQHCFVFSHQLLHSKAARHQHAKRGFRYGGVMAYPPFSITLDGAPDMVYISDGITPFSITARVHDIAGNLVTAGMPVLPDTTPAHWFLVSCYCSY